MKALLIFVFLNAGEAVYEALGDTGHKLAGKLVELGVRGVVYLAVMAWMAGLAPGWLPDITFWQGVAGFLAVRVAIFNAVWNLTARKPHTYLSEHDPYDRLLWWICYRSPIRPPEQAFIPTLEILAAGMSVAILVTETIL